MYKIAGWYALDRRVIAVGVHDGTLWTAYIGAVPGERHEEEYKSVMENGTKLSKNLATYLFPELAEKYEWRE